MRTLGMLAVLLCACGGVKYTSSTTRGVGCGDLSREWCDRLIECAIAASSDKTACNSGGQNGCCGDSHTCGNPIFNADGAANCINMLPGASCSELGVRGAAQLPSYCRQMF